MSDKSKYKKLKGTSFFGSNTLYRGDNHLLSCNSNYFSEEYMRFYYKDIQSIIARKTMTGRVFNVCLTVALAAFLIPAVSISEGLLGSFLSGFFFVLASVVILLLVINLVMGPTVVCYIQTLVQTARLISIKRVRGAEKAISQLKPLIENSQGVLSSERILNTQTDEFTDSPVRTKDWIDVHEEGQYHRALFALLAASSVFIIMDIFFPGILMALLSGIANLSIGTVLVFSLRKQFRTDLFKSIKILTWTVAGYIGVRFLFSYMLYVYVTMMNPNVYLEWELFKNSAAISVRDYSWMMAVYILFLVYTIGVGITGLILIGMFREEYKERESSLNKTGAPEERHE